MVGLNPIDFRDSAWVNEGVNEHDYNSLFSALNEAVEILQRNRTSDPAFVAACDTLKQSRAMIASAIKRTDATATHASELAA